MSEDEVSAGGSSAPEEDDANAEDPLAISPPRHRNKKKSYEHDTTLDSEDLPGEEEGSCTEQEQEAIDNEDYEEEVLARSPLRRNPAYRGPSSVVNVSDEILGEECFADPPPIVKEANEARVDLIERKSVTAVVTSARKRRWSRVSEADEGDSDWAPSPSGPRPKRESSKRVKEIVARLDTTSSSNDDDDLSLRFTCEGPCGKRMLANKRWHSGSNVCKGCAKDLSKFTCYDCRVSLPIGRLSKQSKRKNVCKECHKAFLLRRRSCDGTPDEDLVAQAIPVHRRRPTVVIKTSEFERNFLASYSSLKIPLDTTPVFRHRTRFVRSDVRDLLRLVTGRAVALAEEKKQGTNKLNIKQN